MTNQITVLRETPVTSFTHKPFLECMKLVFVFPPSNARIEVDVVKNTMHERNQRKIMLVFEMLPQLGGAVLRLFALRTRKRTYT